MTRRAIHRSDTRQTEIVKWLRKSYYKASITSSVGDDFPDLVVADSRGIELMEVKTRPAAKRWLLVPVSDLATRNELLSDGQRDFHSTYPRPIAIVFDEFEAIEWMRIADRMRQGYERYEFVRTLNPQQFKDAWLRNITTGQTFDQIIDELMIFRRAGRSRHDPAVAPSPPTVGDPSS